MEITYLGHSCFRLRGREATLVTDPYGPGTGTLGPVAADIATVSHDHPDHAQITAVRGARKVIRRPGEYEVAGVRIKGVRTDHDDQGGRLRGRSIAYLMVVDDVVICHLGDLGHVLTPSQVAELSAAQVLLVPVGGGTTLSVTAAAEVIGLLAPRLVIPMHYRATPQDSQDPSTASEQAPSAPLRTDLATLEPFLRQMGVRQVTPQARLTVTPTSLPPETQVVVLEPRPRG